MLYPVVIEGSGRLAISPVFPTVCHITPLIPTAISPQRNALALTQNTFSVSKSLPDPNPSCLSLCIEYTACLLFPPHSRSLSHIHTFSIFQSLTLFQRLGPTEPSAFCLLVGSVSMSHKRGHC